jgi:ADP-ribose pyrophosphatase YjhB (NUDIX family)
MNQELNGVINHSTSTRKTDYLFRLSLNGIVINDDDQILFVKEDGRDWWDLPGGGMDHGEDVKSALAREMHEEVNLNGDFMFTNQSYLSI